MINLNTYVMIISVIELIPIKKTDKTKPYILSNLFCGIVPIAGINIAIDHDWR